MKKFLPVLGLLAVLFLSGCTQDPTVSVDVYVSDESGKRVEGASVNAYSNYELGTGTENRWLNLNGRLEASAKTNKEGNVKLQVLPGQYAFTASKDEKTGGEEKLIITGQNSVYITISKAKPKEARLTISILDENNKEFDVKAKTVTVNEFICLAPNYGNCGFSASYTAKTNPLETTLSEDKLNQQYSLTFQADSYEEARLEFTPRQGDNLSFTVTMKRKPKVGTFKLNLVDKASPNNLTDVKAEKFTMAIIFCPAEQILDNVFGSEWEKGGIRINCWNTKKAFPVERNPVGHTLPIGNWNFTFFSASYKPQEIVFTLKENEVLEKDVVFVKPTTPKSSTVAKKSTTTPSAATDPLKSLSESVAGGRSASSAGDTVGSSADSSAAGSSSGTSTGTPSTSGTKASPNPSPTPS